MVMVVTPPLTTLNETAPAMLMLMFLLFLISERGVITTVFAAIDMTRMRKSLVKAAVPNAQSSVSASDRKSPLANRIDAPPNTDCAVSISAPELVTALTIGDESKTFGDASVPSP